MVTKRISNLAQLCLILECLAPFPVLGSRQLDGYLDTSSPTWNRIKDTQPMGLASCNAASEDSYNDNVKYTQFHFVPQTNTVLQADIDPVGSSIDSMLALYCAPFNPADPSSNLVAMDDDGNGYPHAGLTSRHIPLQAGHDYYLVVTSYSTYKPEGTYRLLMGDDLTQIHNLQDAIVALQVVAGGDQAASHLNSLADIRENNKVTLATAIKVLQEVADSN